MMVKKIRKKIRYSSLFLSFLFLGMSGRDRLSESCPVLWQDFELFSLSLCPGTREEFLSLFPEKLHCPVLLKTLLQNHFASPFPPSPFLAQASRVAWLRRPGHIYFVFNSEQIYHHHAKYLRPLVFVRLFLKESADLI